MNNYDKRYGASREASGRPSPRRRPPYRNAKYAPPNRSAALSVVKITAIIIFALFLLSIVGLLGGMGETVKKYFMGLFGISAIGIAVAGMLVAALRFFGFRPERIKGKTAFFTFTLIGIFLLFLQIITTVDIFRGVDNTDLSIYLKACFDEGAKTSGGAITGIIAFPFLKYVGARLSLVLLTVLFFGITFFTFLPFLLEDKRPEVEKAKPKEVKPLSEETTLFVDTIDGRKNANKINRKSLFAAKDEKPGFSILNPNKEQEFDIEEDDDIADEAYAVKNDINSADPKLRRQAAKDLLFHMDDEAAKAIFSDAKAKEEDIPVIEQPRPQVTEHKPSDDELPIFFGSRKITKTKANEKLYGNPEKSQRSLLPEEGRERRNIIQEEKKTPKSLLPEEPNTFRAITPEDASSMEYKKERFDSIPQKEEKPPKQSAKDILFGKTIKTSDSKPAIYGTDIRTDGNFSLFGVKKDKRVKEEKSKSTLEDAMKTLDAKAKPARSLLDFDEEKPLNKAKGAGLTDIRDVLFPSKKETPKAPVLHAEQLSIIEKEAAKSIKKSYASPPYALLKDYPPPTIIEDHHEMANNLCNALAAFDINAEVIGHQRGPTFTQFAFRLPDGVSIKRVTGIETDIKRKLKTTEEIRIIPALEGIDAFGIEMPNQSRSKIGMRNLIESPKFSEPNKLYFALGVDVTGTPYYCDLLAMPHLLIAGSTGSGKSVCLNTIICSFLYHYPPEVVKFIMIDPKKVELNVYNGIPHMILNSTVTEWNKAVNALSWAVAEMDRRYSVLQEAGSRSIYDYNAKQSAAGKEKMHYIVIVIDEMADLMTRARKDIEDRVNSLTSKARAAGIHLITATQRPSVDIITGTIKNNLPTRIAFKVSSFADSKTILDKGGADKLFGWGDMLFMSAEFSEPKRLQGPYISDDEVRSVVNYVKNNNNADYDEEASKVIFAEKTAADDAVAAIEESDGEEDDLFEDAVRFVVDSKIGSISMLQRRYHIGFNRAGRLIDAMSARGIVEQLEYGTSKPRAVLITSEDLDRIFKNEEED